MSLWRQLTVEGNDNRQRESAFFCTGVHGRGLCSGGWRSPPGRIWAALTNIVSTNSLSGLSKKKGVRTKKIYKVGRVMEVVLGEIGGKESGEVHTI